MSMEDTQSRATSFSSADRGRAISSLWTDTWLSWLSGSIWAQLQFSYSWAKATVSTAAFHQKAQARMAWPSILS